MRECVECRKSGIRTSTEHCAKFNVVTLMWIGGAAISSVLYLVCGGSAVAWPVILAAAFLSLYSVKTVRAINSRESMCTFHKWIEDASMPWEDYRKSRNGTVLSATAPDEGTMHVQMLLAGKSK